MDAEQHRYSIFNIIVEIVPAGLPLFIQKAVLSLIVRRAKHEQDEGTRSQEELLAKLRRDGIIAP